MCSKNDTKICTKCKKIKLKIYQVQLNQSRNVTLIKEMIMNNNKIINRMKVKSTM